MLYLLNASVLAGKMNCLVILAVSDISLCLLFRFHNMLRHKYPNNIHFDSLRYLTALNFFFNFREADVSLLVLGILFGVALLAFVILLVVCCWYTRRLKNELAGKYFPND